MTQNKVLVDKMSKMQCARRKHRSQLDHIITLYAKAQKNREVDTNILAICRCTVF